MQLPRFYYCNKITLNYFSRNLLIISLKNSLHKESIETPLIERKLMITIDNEFHIIPLNCFSIFKFELQIFPSLFPCWNHQIVRQCVFITSVDNLRAVRIVFKQISLVLGRVLRKGGSLIIQFKFRVLHI